MSPAGRRREMPPPLRNGHGWRHLLTSAQLRAARSLVGWTRDKPAGESGVFANTIKSFESGISDPKLSTLLQGEACA
jgi:hypothetical protein